MSANDKQVAGTHYKTGGEEHWDRVERLHLDYFQGQITKYVERWKKKNGVQDLKKAQHFLEKYIEIEEAKKLAEIGEASRKATHPVYLCGDPVAMAMAFAGPTSSYTNQDRITDSE